MLCSVLAVPEFSYRSRPRVVLYLDRSPPAPGTSTLYVITLQALSHSLLSHPVRMCVLLVPACPGVVICALLRRPFHARALPVRPHIQPACPDRTPHQRADVSFSCVVKTQRRWSNKIYKTELTKTIYNNQVLGKYRVDPQRAGLTLIAELTWSNLGLKGVLNKIK